MVCHGSMFSVVDCANVYKYVLHVSGGKVYLSSVISSAVQVYLQKSCVSPWSAGMEVSAHEFVCACRYVHIGEHACECDELGWPLYYGLKRQLLFSVCLFLLCDL